MESFWYQVLCAMYGEEGDKLSLGGEGGSIWWQPLNKIIEGVGMLNEGWLVNNIW
jgi:hypothetical protein